MADPVYTVAIEFVSGSFTNVSSHCLGFTFTRALADVDNNFSAGRATVSFDNETGRFSPQNSSSPYFGMLTTNKRLKMTATYAGSSYNLFQGYINRVGVDPRIGMRQAVLEADDLISVLQRRRIKSALFTDTVISSLVATTLSLSGVVTTDVATIEAVDLTEAATFYWIQDRQPNQALDSIIKFGSYLGYVDGAGQFVFRNRYFGLGRTATLSLVGDFYSYDYSLTDELVRNNIVAAVEPRVSASTLQVVSQLQEAVTIPSSSGIGFLLNYVDPDIPTESAPATGMVTPVASTDYWFGSTTNSGASDLTNNCSVQVTFFGGSAVCSVWNGTATAAYATKFQLRGYSAQKKPMLSYGTQDTSSQNVYGIKDFTLTSELFSSLPFMRDHADFLLAKYKNVFPELRVGISNQFPDCLSTDLAAVIHIVESLTSVGTDHLVRGVEHTVVLDRGLQHQVIFDVKPYSIGKYFILDDSVYGVLDSDNILGF